MGDGTLFGLIHDIKDRRTAAKVREQKRNYLSDPQAAIQGVNQWDPDEAIAMDTSFRNRQATDAATAEKKTETDRLRYTTALKGVTQTLKRARDTEGVDVLGVYDQMTPVFKTGFGMRDDEVIDWRNKIAADPSILDNLEGALTEQSKGGLKVLSSGAIAVDDDGTVRARNPFKPTIVKTKRGDGGEDTYIMDESGNFISAGQVAAVPATGASAPGQPASYSGPRSIDPTARGMRNGNPGNIKDGTWARRQPGYAGSDGTFARFNTPEAGSVAQEKLLTTNYANGKRNVNQIVDKYLRGDAPASADKENSAAATANYKAYVAGRLGIAPDAIVPPSMVPQLAQAMREFENGGAGGGAAPGGPLKPVISTPGKPVAPQGWRDLSDAEKTARGLDPASVYQIGLGGATIGRIQKVDGSGARSAATGKAGKPAGVSLQAHTTAVNSMRKIRDEARAIRNHSSFGQATGSIQGRLPSITQGSVDFDKRLGSYRDAVVINGLKAMKEASPNGASGFGSLQLKEGERLENYGGSLNQASPEDLARTLRSQENDAIVNLGLLYNIPPSATTLLIQRPALRKDFDKKYGVGTSAKLLGN